MKEPRNYNFWLLVLKNEEELQQFKERGSERQLKSLKECEKYAKARGDL